MDDNFHLYDESERDEEGAYATYAEAVTAAQAVVDHSLRFLYRTGMSREELFDTYMDFGDDPFVRPEEGPSRFSAWSYAEERIPSLIEDLAGTQDA